MDMMAPDDPDYADLQAQFSIAHVSAVAATGGFWIEPAGRGRDKDSIDLTLFKRGSMGLRQSPVLDLQIKSKGVDALTPEDRDIPLQLSQKNYDDLRTEVSPTGLQAPRILVVVLVPRDTTDWIHHTEEATVLRRCAYWSSLMGAPELRSATKVVRVPRQNVFDVVGLHELMLHVGNNESLS